jgi:hypothetical protein
MHVIRHQAVTQQREAIQLRILTQQRHVSQSVRIGGEDDLAGIAALRNMMGNIHRDYTREASHDPKISEMSTAIADANRICCIGIPRLGTNNWGQFRLSPIFVPDFSARLFLFQLGSTVLSSPTIRFFSRNPS